MSQRYGIFDRVRDFEGPDAAEYHVARMKDLIGQKIVEAARLGVPYTITIIAHESRDERRRETITCMELDMRETSYGPAIYPTPGLPDLVERVGKLVEIPVPHRTRSYIPIIQPGKLSPVPDEVYKKGSRAVVEYLASKDRENPAPRRKLDLSDEHVIALEKAWLDGRFPRVEPARVVTESYTLYPKPILVRALLRIRSWLPF